MITKKRYYRFIVLLFCAAIALAFGSCESTKHSAYKPAKYHKDRTSHQPHWNATTSQSTTYYIKKNSTRKGHDSKKIKR